ncbi:GGDEF domain-containing protein [Pseudoblastomonas halimionae]|uniref:diguanylate cyclase n=1 Tax=Alteriqipengyuania halimionae TaxID=1926630 RepID=A0A6I4U471_9SPHN|nr:diguanylate cyclase [Alteriqipengyuania halimionae]MXP09713.1 diguanylate cyclase [Alteriqipengyuania halimionae]
MDKVTAFLRNAAIPDLPEDVRSDFVVANATTVQKQGRWLFVGLLVTCLFAALATPERAGWFVRWGLPGLMAVYCAMGMNSLFRDYQFQQKPWRAERFIIASWKSSLIGALISTSWAIASWFAADPGERLHYPVMLVMGSLATAYCMASIRPAAATHLVIDIGAIAILMLLTGSTLDMAAAVSLCIAGLFQWRMINEHHNQVVELLLLKRHSQALAQTDPLTGLLNRRALLDFAGRLAARDGVSRLLIVDIDCFKVINDAHGHECGDSVLQEVARLIDSHAGENVGAARLGGEEFALLGTTDALRSGTASQLLTDIREAAMPHGGQVTISIGVADGPLEDDAAWRALYRSADTALYAAKRRGRDRVVHARELENAERHRAESLAAQGNLPESKVA